MATAFDTVWQASGQSPQLYTTAGNWSSGIPITNERVLIPAGTAPIDCTGMADVALTSFIVAPGHNGTIGSSGARLTLSALDLVHEGSGKLWFSEGASTTTRVRILAPSNSDVADIIGSMTNLFLQRGGVTINGAGSYTLINVGYEDNPAGDVSLTIEGSGGTQANIIQYGGLVINSSLCTRLDLMAGKFIQRTGTAITTANVGGAAPALLQYESSSTLGTCHARNQGIVDFLTNRTAVVTISELFQHPGSEVREDEKNWTTVTARYDFR